LLDEITEGLAPVIVKKLAEVLRTLEGARIHDRAGRAEFPLCRSAGRPPTMCWSTGASCRPSRAEELPSCTERLHALLGV